MKQYLVYLWRGNLMITEIVWIKGSCRKAEDPRKWHAKVHPRPLSLCYGKVWCYEKDLQKAIDIIKQNYERYAGRMEKEAARINAVNTSINKEKQNEGQGAYRA